MNPLSFLLLLLLAPLTLAGSNEEGLAFLEENKSKEGVVVLPSGLQYKVLNKGSGAHHPTVSSPCLCHYQGTLIDGTVFDSSYERGPTTFAPNQVIKGWTEAMQLMVEGDKFVSTWCGMYTLLALIRARCLLILHCNIQLTDRRCRPLRNYTFQVNWRTATMEVHPRFLEALY